MQFILIVLEARNYGFSLARVIPIHEGSRALGQKNCDALPVSHALTGCDSNSTLSRIGKKKAWDALKRSKVHQESLTMLGQQQDLDETTASKCEAFVCDLYALSRRTPKTPDELGSFSEKEVLPPTSDSL